MTDELLSSWMARLAYANSTRCFSFYNSLIGYPSEIWARDIDRSAKEDLITLLALRTGVSESVINTLKLNDFNGRLVKKVVERGHCPWILDMGVYHRKRTRKGLQYCPQCLKDQAQPYFKKLWRLSFLTVCFKHNCFLLDACPRCGDSIMYHRLGHHRTVYASEIPLCICATCNYDTRKTTSNSLGTTHLGLRTIHRAILSSLINGSPQIELGSTSTVDMFRGLRALIYLLKRPGSIELRKLLIFENRLSTWAISKKQPKEFERMNVACRDCYILMMMALLQDWPHHFHDACKRAGIYWSGFSEHAKLLPNWLRKPALQLKHGI